MTVAFGTSTPTSITVVATSTSTSPARKAAITASFSFAGTRPWSRPRRTPSSSPPASASNVSVAEADLELLEPSTRGQTTYAWRPAATSPRTCAHVAASPLVVCTHTVSTGTALGRCLMTLTSRSP
jgi:hypothetical protein